MQLDLAVELWEEKGRVKKTAEGVDVFVLLHVSLKLEAVNTFVLRAIEQKILPTLNMGIKVKESRIIGIIRQSSFLSHTSFSI